jgi:hypothetical protein
MLDYYEQYAARAQTFRAEAAQARLAHLATCCTPSAVARRLVALRQRIHAALDRKALGEGVCCA